ncbi:MAG: L-rhamnose isomerase [Bacteroidales bacterium]|nr:L-rhamnose isomerase [Bacteroidales bacterium]
MVKEQTQKAFELAVAQYATIGIDVHKVIGQLNSLSISLHCWQADDVHGFENAGSELTGGIQATGNYPGRARTLNELRADLEKVLTLVPGTHRVNLHAIYGDFGGEMVDRDQIEPKHFQSWIDWAKKVGVKLDFNSTFFSHPKSDSGFTLSSPDKEIQSFWMEHLRRCRIISAEIGRQQGSPCIHNIWIPDGTKDRTVNRLAYRENLKYALDTVLEEKFNPNYMSDCIESKLFGIGLESYTVGSHEFYMGYGVKNKMIITLDAGHFHPTEVISDKISSLLLFVPEIMLHVSRPVRWDSDHVVILDDELQHIAQEIIRANALDRVHVGLDYFDASINRIGAYVVGIRATQKAFLQALLEPVELLRAFESEGKNFERMAVLEEMKSMPWGAVYNYYCEQAGITIDYVSEIESYESSLISKR